MCEYMVQLKAHDSKRNTVVMDSTLGERQTTASRQHQRGKTQHTGCDRDGNIANRALRLLVSKKLVLFFFFL